MDIQAGKCLEVKSRIDGAGSAISEELEAGSVATFEEIKNISLEEKITIDELVSKQIVYMMNIYESKESSMNAIIKDIGVNEFGLQLDVGRKDDETYASRNMRIEEFFSTTVPEVLEGELRYAVHNNISAPPQVEGRLAMVNGLARGIDYSILTNNVAPELATLVCLRMLDKDPRYRIIGAEYNPRNTSTERL